MREGIGTRGGGGGADGGGFAGSMAGAALETRSASEGGGGGKEGVTAGLAAGFSGSDELPLMFVPLFPQQADEGCSHLCAPATRCIAPEFCRSLLNLP